MKKVVLIIFLFIAFVNTSEAQIEAGKYVVGGSLGSTFTPAFTLNLDARVGYFLTENIALGGAVGLNAGGGNVGINIAPAVRYYMSIMEKTYIFGHAGVGLNTANNTTTIGLNAYPGVAYFLNERLAIEGSLGGLGGGGLGLFLLF